MTWRRRAVGIAAAVVLVAIALMYAFRPFTKAVGFPGVSGECRAPVLSAPGGGNDDDELALWAVTVGTDEMGFMPVFGEKVKYVRLGSEEFSSSIGELPDGVCATRARERLAAGALFLIGAVVVLFLTVRHHRHAPGRG